MQEYQYPYSNCRLCPRGCAVDRTAGQKGLCGALAEVKVSSAVLHKGEEPPLTGAKGSGAIFFSGCGLGCADCQNQQLSRRGGIGAEMSTDDLCALMLELQLRGAANINLVTAGHFAPSAAAAASAARSAGLTVPVVWNTSGYETAETISQISDYIDIWLPDLKTLDSALAGKMFSAPDYPRTASDAIIMMAGASERKGGLLVEDGKLRRGLVMRHLVIPGELKASENVLKWYSEHLKDRALLSLMVQYTAMDGREAEISEPDYQFLMGLLEEYGIDEGFIQSPEAADRGWIPDFRNINPFPAEFSEPVWHWKEGMIR